MNNVTFFLLLFSLCSCTGKNEATVNPAAQKMELMEADRGFSDFSEQKGMKAAFMEYIDSNGVLLRPNYLPLVGAHAIDFLLELNDTSYTLKWQPHDAFVSKSADLGYTYGIYALNPKSGDSTIYGTYVSIWKKQANGKWKFVLDTGNEGIGKKE